MTKKNKNRIFVIIGIIILAYFLIERDGELFQGYTGSFLDPCAQDGSCCTGENTLGAFCLRNDVNIDRVPLKGSDLQYTERTCGGETQGKVGLRYKGSLIRPDKGCNFLGQGMGNLYIDGYNRFFRAMQMEQGPGNGYLWTPTGAYFWGETWGGGHRNVEIELHYLSEYTLIHKGRMKCLEVAGCNGWYYNSRPDSTYLEGASVVNVNGRDGVRIDMNIGSTTAPVYRSYYLFTNLSLDSIDVTTPTDIRMYFSYAYNEEIDFTALFVDENDLGMVEAYFNDPNYYIDLSTQAWEDYINMFEPAPGSLTAAEKKAYYMSLDVMWGSMHRHDNPTTLWGDYIAMTPGSGYVGVWIWDSFFAAWMHAAACKTGGSGFNQECFDLPRQWVKILYENKEPDGKWPREVWSHSKGIGWQAPGGWPLAIWKLHEQNPDATYLCEVYPELKAYHEWVRESDTNSNNLFQWSGTNSGWDGSARWDGGAVEAVDLQAWMIIGAEYLEKIAEVCVPGDVPLWQQRYSDYQTAAANMWDSTDNVFYDLSTSNQLPATPGGVSIISPAMFFMSFANAATPSQTTLMASHLSNPLTLGEGAPANSANPTVARNHPLYRGVGWDGANWLNINYITYAGFKRQGLDTEANFIRDQSMGLVSAWPTTWESFDSATGGPSPSGEFGGDQYIWTAALYVALAHEWEPFEEVVDPCASETCGNGVCSTICGETEANCPSDCGLPPVNYNLVCVGNSITNGGYCTTAGDESYIDIAWALGFSGRSSYEFVTDCSVPGGTDCGCGPPGSAPPSTWDNDEMCMDYVVFKINENPSIPFEKAILLVGTNDLNINHDNGGQTTVAEYYNYLTQTVQILKGEGLDVVISTLPPCGLADWQCSGGDTTKIEERNDVIRLVSDEQQVKYADIFTDVFGGVFTSSMFTDDLHPNSATHDLMAAVYIQALESGTPYDCASGGCYDPSSIPSLSCSVNSDCGFGWDCVGSECVLNEPIDWTYQEVADLTSNDDSGAEVYDDGDWTNYYTPPYPADVNFYMDFNQPVSITQAKLRMRYYNQVDNSFPEIPEYQVVLWDFALPSYCLDSDPVKLHMYYYGGDGFYYLYCYDGSTWQTFKDVAAGKDFYEFGLWWGTGEIVCNTDADTNCDGTVDDTELLDYIGLWVNNLISNTQLLDGITGWATS